GGNLTLGTSLSGGLTLGRDITASGNTVTLNSVGSITQSSGIITAATLTGSSVGGAVLNDANLLATFGRWSNTGSGLLSITNAQALATAGTINSAGNLTLTTTAGGLTLGGDVTASGNTVTLTSAGTITQSSGIITAGTLTGGSVGNATFGQTNAIANLGAFATGNGNLSLNDSIGLNITGVVNAGTGNLGLTIAGAITEESGGVINAGTLATQSTSGTSLNGQNRIGTLAASTNTGAGGFSLNNVAGL